jgi:two-component system, LuxR family, sensor kinase FixL
MSWVTILWSMFASACLTLAAIHYIVWFRRRTEWANLAFSVMAVSTAFMAVSELWMMQSGTPGQFATALRWAHVPVFTVTVAIVIFTRLRLRAGRAWLAWTICLLRALALILNFLVGPNLNYREIIGLRPIAFLGEFVSIVEGVPNPLMLCGQLVTALLVLFLADAAACTWRRGDKRAAFTVGGSMLFFVVAAFVHSVLVFWNIIAAPLMNSVFYTGVVAIMGYEVTRDVLRAGKLANDLVESEARYRNIFEGAIEGIYRVSFEGRVLYANPALAKILGYDSAEDVIWSIADTGHQIWANPEECSNLIQQAEKGEMVRGHECQFRRKDGSLIWVSLKSSPIRGRDRQILYFDGFVEDIDERKRAHEMLKKSERFLAETARIGKVGGWEVELDTGNLMWTKETYAIHEVDPDYELSVEKGLNFYAPACKPIIEQVVHNSIEHGEAYDLELEIITAKGHRREIRTIGRADFDRRRIYGFIQDISERKRHELEMTELRHELSHLTRFLTVNEISSSLAHEMNQPLGAILNNAEAARILLFQPRDGQESISEIIDDIIRDVKRAGEVVRKVRSVLIRGNVRFESLSINSLIDESLQILRNNFVLNDITLRLDLMPDLAFIKGDRIRLQQVLLNLVMNALDAMKESPLRILTIRTAMNDPDLVIVSISDSGPGIPEASQPKLFDQFFTTKKDGLGLGLPICQSIVREHGGDIGGTNNPGGGATFSFSLKAWREESAVTC